MASNWRLRLSLRSLFVAIALLGLLAAVPGACARRNAALLRLFKETQFGYRPRVQEVIVRTPPLSGSHSFANQSQAQLWLEQRPRWHSLVTWPVIERANIICERGAAPDLNWESDKVPMLRQLGIESVELSRDGLSDNDMDWIAQLNLRELAVNDDGENLTDASLSKLQNATSLRVLEISLQAFSGVAITHLKDSRKWDMFQVDTMPAGN